MTQSPFRKFEETYCNNCDDYNGCVGLVVSMSTSMGEINFKDSSRGTNEWINSLQRNMGAMTFTSRYELILKCIKVREWLKE